MNIKKSTIIKSICLLILAIIVALIAINWGLIRDLYQSITYQPTSEMAIIRDSLNLTGRGELIFNASHPELNDKDDFNAHCRTIDDEGAILGCYTESKIHVYNITEASLKGIRELTAAHELLHAVWERMDEGTQKDLDNALAQVLASNRDLLQKEIDSYDEEQKKQELYVRAGTEVKELPDKLEKHYAEIFQDQDGIVKFYDSYIGVFRRLETEMDSLKAEMANIETEVNQKTDEYKQRFANLDAEIEQFNNCAETAGCFASEWQFRTRRNELLAEKQALDELFDAIDVLIDKYNNDVERYNNDVLHNNRLVKIVNSNEAVEEIE